MNAVPTVQGILKAIIDNTEFTINSSKCAIFGYGRIGSLTADILSSIGAKVTVCARKYSDLAKATSKGLDSCFIKDFSSIADEFDIIVNTVPAVIINRDILVKLKKSVLSLTLHQHRTERILPLHPSLVSMRFSVHLCRARLHQRRQEKLSLTVF